MTVAGPLLVLVAFGAALFLLSQPFWPGHVEKVAERDDLRRADLEAAKIAKYREIRDTELDHATGKLSDADWRPIDARLRAEAVRILDELDGLGGDTRAPRTDDLPVAPADPQTADGGAATDAAQGDEPAAGTPGGRAPSADAADAAATR
ncbi:hypothetical protein [Patulibacter americanus]|uniref:hypothetical protein n=1 Tax=Patulibacter americanus TaxID=588672 RepID=UPI0003B78D13|nr:hypothetical protein [Patulibacter americanus]